MADRRGRCGALWALKEEISAGNLVRVDPEYEWGQPVAQRRRKQHTFTLTATGLKNMRSARGDGGPGILAWRAKTREHCHKVGSQI